jgi:hypothetical protein
MLENNKILKVFMGDDEPVPGLIVRCEVVLGSQGKILFPLAFTSQVEFSCMPLCTRDIILPILEVRPL